MARIQDGRDLVRLKLSSVPDAANAADTSSPSRTTARGMLCYSARRFLLPSTIERVQGSVLSTMRDDSLARGS